MFLGAGQMAEALIRGVLAAKLVGPLQIMATDIILERIEYLARELGIRTASSKNEALEFGRLIVIAVKPQDVPALLEEISPLLGDDHVVVSIAAGVTIATLERSLEEPVHPPGGPPGRPGGMPDTVSAARLATVPVVRVMPNTPALVGAGMAAVALGHHADASHGELVLQLMSSVGQAVMLPEYQLDAVTGLSASGPAFVAMFVEGLIDAGVRVGLPRDVATTLTLQTVLGTTKMMQSTGRHPAMMKEMVTSPGGTTIAGINALERGGCRAALIDAIVAVTKHSEALGRADER